MGSREPVHVREQPVDLVVLLVVRGVVLLHVADRNLPDDDRAADRLGHLFPIGELRGPLLGAPETVVSAILRQGIEAVAPTHSPRSSAQDRAALRLVRLRIARLSSSARRAARW